jgi:hypothetical protein
MKALTLHQPYAILIALGEKQYETRSWTVSYRDKVAIHAGRTWNNDTKSWTQMSILKLGIKLPDMMPLGALLCICELRAIYHTEALLPKLTEKERRLGDYSAGRFAWRLEVIEVFDNPIFVGGKQGLWDLELSKLQSGEPSYARV